MTLRILGGNLRGRSLLTPKGARTRPTTSMLRKAVFDILQDSIQEAQFLDLFAGSGAMGIEALSRGAAHASFVEADRQAFRIIHENLKQLQLSAQASVYSASVSEMLKKFLKEGKNFNMIYADPPYHMISFYEELLHFVDTSSLLLPGGTLFLESLSPSPLKPSHFNSLIFKDERRFGSSLLHQYRKSSS